MTTTATGDDVNDGGDGGDGAAGDEIDDDGDGAAGDGATGYDNGDDDGGGTTGDKVDDYGKGATGDNDDNDNDDNGDGTERHNNQIEATAAVGGFASCASWRFASPCRRHAWPLRARQFTPRCPRCACQLFAQRCHRRARWQFARLMSSSPCMLATCPPSPPPRVAIASAVIHPPSPLPRVTATRPTSPSPRAGDSPVVAFAVAPATAPRTQDYPLPRGEVNKKYIHMPRGYF